jgi:hypothetical protein
MKILFQNFGRLLLIATALLCAAARFQTDPSVNDQLMAAAKKGDTEAVKALLAKGADVNTKSPYGATPLFFACDRGHVEIVKILLEKGADLQTKDTFYKSTPVTWAVMKDQAEVVKLLVEKAPETKESTTGQAVMQGQTKTAVALIGTGGYKPESLSIWLGIAEKNKNAEIVEALKKAGAKPPEPKPEYKITPEQLQRYTGVFKNEQFELSFAVKDGKLTVTANGGEIAFKPVGEHVFDAISGPPVTATFKLEADKVTGLAVKSPGGESTLKKQETK